MADASDHEVTIDDVNRLRDVWRSAREAAYSKLDGKALRGGVSSSGELTLGDLKAKDADIAAAKEAAEGKLPKGMEYSVKVNGILTKLGTMAKAIEVFSGQANSAKKKQGRSKPCAKRYKKGYVKEVSPSSPSEPVDANWMSPSFRVVSLSQKNISISGTGFDFCASGVFIKLSGFSCGLVVKSVEDTTKKSVFDGVGDVFDALSSKLSAAETAVKAAETELAKLKSRAAGSGLDNRVNETNQKAVEGQF